VIVIRFWQRFLLGWILCSQVAVSHATETVNSRCTNHTPKFSEYPSVETFVTKRPALRQDNPFARRFRTVLDHTLRNTPINLAGHFIKTTIGCGTNCQRVAVINALTGQVVEWPGLFEVGDEPDQEGLATRSNSRLVIYQGIPNDGYQGTRAFHYFEAKDGKLTLICRKAVPLMNLFSEIMPRPATYWAFGKNTTNRKN
jgi:hypothetical protein